MKLLSMMGAIAASMITGNVDPRRFAALGSVGRHRSRGNNAKVPVGTQGLRERTRRILQMSRGVLPMSAQVI